MIWLTYLILAIKINKTIPGLSKKSDKKFLKKPPLVSIIIPARNEETRIKKCIETIKSQTYPNFEVFIVDDFSIDKTVEVVKKIIDKDKRFKIIELKLNKKEKPSGWMGKTYALQEGSKHAKGEWLFFIDADTYHEPELIQRAVEYGVKNKIDLLSLMPLNICESFWEKVIQPIPSELLILPLWKVNDPKSKIALAFGPFIQIRNSVFIKIRGYTTIKEMIADDYNLAKLVKKAGYKIGLIKAQSLMKVKMYSGLSDLWAGWGKHVFGILQNPSFKTKPKKTLVILTYLFGIFETFILPFLAFIVMLILGLILLFPQWQYFLLFAFATWILATIAQFYAMKRFYIGDQKYAPLTFLGGFVFFGTFLNSAIKILFRKGVTWKGRKINK